MSKLIALTGAMGSGKTTVLEMLKQRVPAQVKYVKFAQPLYDIQAYVYDRVRQPHPQPKDRKLLQWLGTEWGRGIDENLWVNIFKVEAEEALTEGAYVLNDDTRFENEAQMIKALGGVVVLIEASSEVRGQRIQLLNTGHPSEAGIPSKYIDYTLRNNGSLEELSQQVSTLLNALEAK
jgi:dephospho-CoA kinase